MKTAPFALGAVVLAAALTLGVTAQSKLPSPDPDDGAITLPPGFRALVVADNLVVGKKSGNTAEKLRGIAVAPNGDIYAKTRLGQIFALRDTTSDGRVDEIKEFGPGDGGTHIAFHDGWLYHSSRTAVYRYKYTPGELVPSGELQTVVAKLPAERDHDAKAFAFDESGRMLVEIGSPYNVYSKPDRQLGAKGMDATEFQKTYGGFWRFDANKLNQTQADGARFSTGHRHALALAWHPVSKQFFMVADGTRQPQRRRSRALRRARQRRARVRSDAPAQRRIELRLADDLLGSDQESAHAGAGVRRRQHQARRSGSVRQAGGRVPRTLGADSDGRLHRHAVPGEVSQRRVRRLPRLVESRAARAGRLSRSRSCHSTTRECRLGTYETFADDFAGKREFVNTGDAQLPAGSVWQSVPMVRSTSAIPKKAASGE